VARAEAAQIAGITSTVEAFLDKVASATLTRADRSLNITLTRGPRVAGV
jgi:hypothetical protein